MNFSQPPPPIQPGATYRNRPVNPNLLYKTCQFEQPRPTRHVVNPPLRVTQPNIPYQLPVRQQPVQLVHPQVIPPPVYQPQPYTTLQPPGNIPPGCILIQKPPDSDQIYQSHTTPHFDQWAIPSSPCVPFPPPNLSHPPPPINQPLVSPTLRPLPSPRYETPPKTPVNSLAGPTFLSPPPPYSNPLVPVYPITPNHPPLSQPDLIPDLRHQFLSNQLLPHPGQVVLLPPLPPDRSVQTIQLLTPGPSAQFQVQTIVLPIIKVDNPELRDNNLPDTGEGTELLLNQIDSTGLPAVMEGVDLEQVRKFATELKTTRLRLGLTQAQVGQSLSRQSGDQTVSQSTICRFEKLEITANQVKKLLPLLQRWLADVQARHNAGLPLIGDDITDVTTAARDIKKRKKRTVFNQETVAILTEEFNACPSPSSESVRELSDRLDLDKETVRVWFCNKRQQNRKSQS